MSRRQSREQDLLCGPMVGALCLGSLRLGVPDWGWLGPNPESHVWEQKDGELGRGHGSGPRGWNSVHGMNASRCGPSDSGGDSE